MFTPPLVARSQAMQDTVRLAQMFARSPRPLLLRGPAGAGKRTLATHVHAWSPRTRLIEVDCADPASNSRLQRLLQPSSQASRCLQPVPPPRKGLFSGAGAGTLLLLAIDTLPPHLQHALATALNEDHRCRVIATARTRGRIVGRLLHAIPQQLNVPGLAQRRADVVPLASSIANELAYPATPRLTPTANYYLTEQDWAGNVSELRLLIGCALGQLQRAGTGPVRFLCPDCARPYKVPSKYAGKRLRCRRCKERVVVPPHEARDVRQISGRDLLAARQDPLFDAAEPAVGHAWFRTERPRILRRFVGASALSIEVRPRLCASAEPVGRIPPLPPTPPLPAWPASSPGCVRAIPAQRPLLALPDDQAARPLPAIPDPLDMAVLELSREMWTQKDEGLFPERRRAPKLALACARQLRFGTEGRNALRSAVPTLLLVMIALPLLCFSLADPTTRTSREPSRASEPVERSHLRELQGEIREAVDLGSYQPWAIGLGGLVFAGVVSAYCRRHEREDDVRLLGL